MTAAPVEIDLALCDASLRARPIDDASVKTLAMSIGVNGLLNPITVRRAVVSRGGRMIDGFEIVAGHHRVKAFGLLGRETIPAFVVELDDLHAELALIDENLCRNDLTPAERAAATARRKAIHVQIFGPPKAKGAAAAHAAMGHEHDANANFAFAFTSETANATGRSERTVQLDAHRGEALGEDALRVARTSLDSGLDRAADNHYPTSAIEEIAARDVVSIAADDCVLFLWSPANRVADAIDVMRGWGFAYVSQIVWGKTRAGTGYWVRDKHEVLLIGRRGKPPAPAPGTQCESLIVAPQGEHSAKPEIFLEIIERYFPNLPKIELNRRGASRPGWAAWGNEADGPTPDEAASSPASPEAASSCPAWWTEARRMREAGARIFDIAARFCKSPATVHEALTKMGATRALPLSTGPVP